MDPDRLGSIRAIQTEQELPLISLQEADAVKAATKGQVPLSEKARTRPILSEEGRVTGIKRKAPPFAFERRIFCQHVFLLVYPEVARVTFNQFHICSTLAKSEHQGREVLISG
jgi:hypothetical protein